MKNGSWIIKHGSDSWDIAGCTSKLLGPKVGPSIRDGEVGA